MVAFIEAVKERTKSTNTQYHCKQYVCMYKTTVCSILRQNFLDQNNIRLFRVSCTLSLANTELFSHFYKELQTRLSNLDDVRYGLTITCKKTVVQCTTQTLKLASSHDFSEGQRLLQATGQCKNHVCQTIGCEDMISSMNYRR